VGKKHATSLGTAEVLIEKESLDFEYSAKQGGEGSVFLTIHLCIYVSMYLCIYVSMYLCIYVSMYLCIYVSIYVYVSMYLCTYVFVYLCIDVIYVIM